MIGSYSREVAIIFRLCLIGFRKCIQYADLLDVSGSAADENFIVTRIGVKDYWCIEVYMSNIGCSYRQGIIYSPNPEKKLSA